MLRIIVQVILLSICIALNLNNIHQRFRSHIYYSKYLLLQFQYACAQQPSPTPCKLEVQWNGKTIKQIQVTDLVIHREQLKFQAQYGENILTFVGAGDSNTQGIAISHISLTRTIQRRWRKNQHQQLIKNRDLEIATPSDQFGWEGGDIRIIEGSTINSNWAKGVKICELPSKRTISQAVYFGRRFTTISKQSYEHLASLEKILILTFNYGAHEHTDLKDNRFVVDWNGRTVADITPSDFKVHKAVIKFSPLPGQKNTLTFKGFGNNSSVGCGFQEASIRRQFSLFHMRNQPFKFIKNSWFESNRYMISKEETIFDNGMESWRGSPIHISLSTEVNRYWDKGNINHFPVCELVKGGQVSQDIYFDNQYRHIQPQIPVDRNQLLLGFSYAAIPGSALANSKFRVEFNGDKIAQATPKDFKKHYFLIKVTGIVGKNSLRFVGEGKESQKGVGLSYITLKRMSPKMAPPNLITNHIFSDKKKQCSSSGWLTDNIKVLPGKAYNHSWSWDSKGCACALFPEGSITYSFQLNSIYQYVDPRQESLPLATKRRLNFQFGYYAEGHTAPQNSKFTIEWNGIIVKQIVPTNYRQVQGNIELEAQVGKNTLRLIGCGVNQGKGGAFNFIRLRRASELFHPEYLIVNYLLNQKNGACPSGLPPWKGDQLAIVKGSEFNPAVFFGCLAQLKKGQQIQADITFSDKYQSI